MDPNAANLKAPISASEAAEQAADGPTAIEHEANEQQPGGGQDALNKEAGRKIARAKAGRQTPPRTSLTPAMQQYLEQKQQVGDAILLFRMGDFYETFFDDAKTIARVLGLTLTARNKNSGSPIPLAGVPYHAVDGYIAKLVAAGYKVAISEQQEDPRLAKGVVRRGVERIITPGTLTDEALLDERRNNYLAAVCPSRGRRTAGLTGLACVELASGRFFAQMVRADELSDELARLRPAELLAPESDMEAEDPFTESLRGMLETAVSPRPPHVFDPHMAERRICEQFSVSSVAGFGFDAFDESLCAAAAILEYLQETQKSALRHILKIVPHQTADRVMIDQSALRALEVEQTLRDGAREGTLLSAIDMTSGAMGARRLREWLCFPVLNCGEIRCRQEAIASLRGEPDRLRRLRELLGGIGDIERISARLGVGRASPRDLVLLGEALKRCGTMSELIGPPVRAAAVDAEDLLTRLAGSLSGHEELVVFLGGALKADAPSIVRDGGYIADGFDGELDRLRNIAREGHQWLAAFQAREAQRTKIPTLKVGYNSVFGYYIEITHQHRDKVPADYVRKQTIRNAERYITDELKRHESEVLGAADKANQLELDLFNKIRDRVADALPRLRETADGVAVLDVLAGLSELSRRRDYCRPEVVPHDGDGGAGDSACGVLEIVDGRHPVLDATLGEQFVPNDCRLSSDENRLLVITGPNMAGKSTYIRQVALLVLLAQTGSYVPAKSMRWSPVDRIFARVGASDELARGQSTFMVEMVETARILNNATSRSLVILDEIGRGTSTYDGLALAWAVTEHIAGRIGCRTLFATHYHELTDLAESLPGVANFNVAVHEALRPAGLGRDIVFLHKIVPGATDRSYGVHVAAMAGLPASVLKRSEVILAELERGFANKSHGDAEGGGSRGRAQSNQLLLFPAADPMPEWWRELVDALGEVDVERTTPVEAISILQRLQSLLRDKP
ncbi:MAG: DNA mismatch repair protein MutS [Planctomycetota bacterium]